MGFYGGFGFHEDSLGLHSKMKFKDITSVLDLYILEPGLKTIEESRFEDCFIYSSLRIFLFA